MQHNLDGPSKNTVLMRERTHALFQGKVETYKLLIKKAQNSATPIEGRTVAMDTDVYLSSVSANEWSRLDFLMVEWLSWGGGTTAGKLTQH